MNNLHRHYINLTCVDSGEHARESNGGKPKRYNFSAFVVDVEGVLLAITAGHVFEELRQAVALGSILSDWAIDDSMVSDHGFPAYPVDVNLDKDILFFHEDGLDYGAYLLDPMASIALDIARVFRDLPVLTGPGNTLKQWCLINFAFSSIEDFAMLLRYINNLAVDSGIDQLCFVCSKEHKAVRELKGFLRLGFNSMMYVKTFDGGMNLGDAELWISGVSL